MWPGLSSTSRAQDLSAFLFDLVRRGDQLRDIGIEAVQLALGTGPRRAAFRGISAGNAIVATARSLADARREGRALRPEVRVFVRDALL